MPFVAALSELSTTFLYHVEGEKRQRVNPDEYLAELERLLKAIAEGEGVFDEFEKLLQEISESEQSWEILEDSQLEIYYLVNDAEWRSDEIGEGAIKDPRVFELLYKYICPEYEDIEVVLASSPFCPPSVIAQLEKSDYSWEEDGTTQALARNQSDPLLLTRLSQSEDSSTRYYVAENQATPPEVLAVLAADNEVSHSLFHMYRYDSDPTSHCRTYIRHAVAENPKTPIEVLKAMRDQLSTGEGVEVPEWVHPESFEEAKVAIIELLTRRIG